MSELRRDLTLTHGIAIVVGITIGTGVFLKSAPMAQAVGSPLLVMAAWAVAGLVAVLGALCFAELGTLIPRAGGEYQYVRAAFGDLPGFVYVCMSILIGETVMIVSDDQTAEEDPFSNESTDKRGIVEGDETDSIAGDLTFEVSDMKTKEMRSPEADVEILELTYVTCLYDMHAVMSRALRLEYDDVPDPITEVPAPAAASNDVMSMVDRAGNS